MSDLISRSEVINLLYQIFEKHSMATDKNDSLGGFGADVFKSVREMPTAYSVDKVVQELEGAMWLTTNDDGETNNLSIQVVSFEDAIEIVKQGGVADDVCEWKQASTARYKTSCGYKLEEYFDTNACYCKQCGKRIKVV